MTTTGCSKQLHGDRQAVAHLVDSFPRPAPTANTGTCNPPRSLSPRRCVSALCGQHRPKDEDRVPFMTLTPSSITSCGGAAVVSDGTGARSHADYRSPLDAVPLDAPAAHMGRRRTPGNLGDRGSGSNVPPCRDPVQRVLQQLIEVEAAEAIGRGRTNAPRAGSRSATGHVPVWALQMRGRLDRRVRIRGGLPLVAAVDEQSTLHPVPRRCAEYWSGGSSRGMRGGAATRTGSGPLSKEPPWPMIALNAISRISFGCI